MQKSESINELMAAVVRAQVKLQPAKKDATNPFFHSKYADLPAVWEALAPFRAEGIAIIQSPAEAEAFQYHSVLEVADKDKCERDDRSVCQIAIETIMVHAESGQWISSRLVMPMAKNDPQGAGSALTYARRYALGCMTGLVTEDDDDGNAASHVKRQPAPMKPPVPAPSVPQQAAPAPLTHTGVDRGEAGFIWKIHGKHKEESIKSIDSEYLEWFTQVGKRADHVEAASLELDLRRGQEDMRSALESYPEKFA